MAIYQNFAQCYDYLMRGTPYDKWVADILRIFKKFRKSPKLVLELACGTGGVTSRLSRKGCDMIGLDISEEMLAIAKRKHPGIFFTNQNMADFELYGTVDAAVCLCDGMNYILTKNELKRVFKLIKNYLNPGGIFIFDLITEEKFKLILADNVFTHNESPAAYIWENGYDKTRRINEYNVTFFMLDPETGQYARFTETHRQRAYTVNEILSSSQKAGLNTLEIIDYEPGERLWFVMEA
jgi:SAM-dependent methyltransferase